MSQIPWLTGDSLEFPATEQALRSPNGLLAVGGDLSPARLLAAYRQGIFPWFNDSQPILWWSPSPRAVMFPQQFRPSRSLLRSERRQRWQIRCDHQFAATIRHCAEAPRRGNPGTWLTRDMIEAYCTLHRQGIAHSIECWQGETLVGGLYGLAIGRVFFGESMFSLQTDASKAAFHALCVQLTEWGFPLIDCQVGNPHLQQLGVAMIDRPEFLSILKEHLDRPAPDWRDFGAKHSKP